MTSKDAELMAWRKINTWYCTLRINQNMSVEGIQKNTSLALEPAVKRGIIALCNGDSNELELAVADFVRAKVVRKIKVV